MKFVCTTRLNNLRDDFEKHANGQDFQSFVEASLDNRKVICLDAEEVKEVLERLCDEGYDYLMECEDADLEIWGEDYLKRINFFSRLLGEKEELTLQEIKEDREKEV